MPASASGRFFASRRGLLKRFTATGPIVDQGWYFQLQSEALAAAVLTAVERVGGVALVE